MTTGKQSKTIDSEWQRELGTAIRTVAKARGVRILDLAVALDVSPQQVHSRLNGDTSITVGEFKRIAAALGLDPAALLSLPDDLYAVVGGPDQAGRISVWESALVAA